MRLNRVVIVACLLFGALVAWGWHPVCEPLSREDLTAFSMPIENRGSERMWGIRAFQFKDGSWCQCKPWLARQMFF
jgi:hypothetical protein